MSDKYLIRNCPALYQINGMTNECLGTDYQCQDCTDCLLKQIVELCKNKDYFVKRFPNAQFSSAVQNSELAFDILQLLDIEEIK